MQLLESHVFTGAAHGPRLIILGAVHGNEIAGTRGIERLMRVLDSGQVRITAGQLTLVPVTNRLAYERGTRNGDRNLNRHLAPTASPNDNEDRVANELCPLLVAHEVLLDLHSFRSQGDPFVLVGPEDNQEPLQPFGQAATEVALAQRLGVSRAMDGWLATYAAGAAQRGASAAYGIGTTEYMRSVGGAALTLECGQHEDPQGPTVAYRAIMNTLAHLRMVDLPAPPAQSPVEGLRLTAVIDRKDAGDSFAQPWKSFDPVKAQERIATRADGTVLTAPDDGYVVFPHANAQPGSEWFYFAKRHPRLGGI